MENREPRRDAVIGRDFQGALPHNLTTEQRLAVVLVFASFLNARYRTPLVYSIPRSRAPTTTRGTGTCTCGCRRGTWTEKKLNRLNLATGGREETKLLRDAWELVANDALGRAGLEPSVSTGRNPDNDPEPTLGADATARERAHRWELQEQGEAVFPVGGSVSQMVRDGRAVTGEGQNLEHHGVRKRQRQEAAAQRPPRKRRRRVRKHHGADARTGRPGTRQTPHARTHKARGDLVTGPETETTGDEETQAGTGAPTQWGGALSLEDRGAAGNGTRESRNCSAHPRSSGPRDDPNRAPSCEEVAGGLRTDRDVRGRSSDWG